MEIRICRSIHPVGATDVKGKGLRTRLCEGQGQHRLAMMMMMMMMKLRQQVPGLLSRFHLYSTLHYHAANAHRTAGNPVVNIFVC